MNGDQGAEKMVDANLFDIRNGKPSGALNTKIANWVGKMDCGGAQKPKTKKCCPLQGRDVECDSCLSVVGIQRSHSQPGVCGKLSYSVLACRNRGRISMAMSEFDHEHIGTR